MYNIYHQNLSPRVKMG